jgi:hypothetical protein
MLSRAAYTISFGVYHGHIKVRQPISLVRKETFI